VEIGDGPAAVTGDERCIIVTDQRLGRRGGRMNRESEYLPETNSLSPWIWEMAAIRGFIRASPDHLI